MAKPKPKPKDELTRFKLGGGCGCCGSSIAKYVVLALRWKIVCKNDSFQYTRNGGARTLPAKNQFNDRQVPPSGAD